MTRARAVGSGFVLDRRAPTRIPCDTAALDGVIAETEIAVRAGYVVVWTLEGEDRISFEREGGKTKGTVIG